ncbi:MAG: hypothetical protein KatS3mg024_1464 [Armatimonadota bacterium]|nr:MAG: hypothetical protein KatS3mg024_1464 [Armatimonadota bacterium]
MRQKAFSATLAIAAVLLLHLLAHSPSWAAGLRLRAERHSIAVLDESGRKLGAFVRPESDLDLSGQETFRPVLVRAEAGSGRMVWRSSLDYEVEVALETRTSPPRVEARVKARNLSATARQVYLYFPFEREDVMEHPRLISFAVDGDELLPFEREMPGEGITAFWSTSDLNLARPDAELLLPVVAAQIPSGFLVAGFDPASAFAIRFHREVRLEFARRFFLPAGNGMEDAMPLSLCTAWNRHYAFYIGKAPEGMGWAQIYREWFLELNPSRLRARPGLHTLLPAQRATAPASEGQSPAGGDEEPQEGMRGKILLEFLGRAASGPDGRPDPAAQDSLVLTPRGQPVPDRDGWKVNISPRFSFGKKLLLQLEEIDASRWAGALLDTGSDANRVDRNRRLPPYPFFPHHHAAAELLCEARKRIEGRGLVLAARTDHPASPALEMADLLVADASTDRIAGVRLAAGSLPVAAGRSSDRATWLRALFFGCVPPTESPAGFPAAGLFAALGEAAVTDGSPRPDRLEFASPSGEIWVTVRNVDPLPTERPVSFSASLQTRAGQQSWEVFSWSPMEGLQIHGQRNTSGLPNLTVTMPLAPGDTGILFAVPSSLASQEPYASLRKPKTLQNVQQTGN